ncbi:hypothetical protein ABN028_17985 [Actinopolymorpha sp. B17G11]|uniref:hypothetical protein n=1 Tax=unclassified Actinopolymorpha TaxID=2627063 RepID=UPI0032D934CD
MTKAHREAQRLAYQALQEALDRRDNGGRTAAAVAETRTAHDSRDATPRPRPAVAPSGNPVR